MNDLFQIHGYPTLIVCFFRRLNAVIYFADGYKKTITQEGFFRILNASRLNSRAYLTCLKSTDEELAYQIEYS